jgi:endonuclease/exonuclease/phosphatase family metal-dependent hydrolase
MLEEGIFLPLRIINNAKEVAHLLAVWTRQEKEKGGKDKYPESAINAVEKFNTFLEYNPSYIAGDFNTNAQWDAGYAENDQPNHSDLVKKLGELGFESAYHKHFGEGHGSEKTKTHYQPSGSGYHIDYIFLPKQLEIRNFNIGLEKEDSYWLKYSDHLPLMVELG